MSEEKVSDFVHLHLHTDYSLLDGACAFEKPDKNTKAPLPELLKAHHMKACAITDHGFMGGCLNFSSEMTANKMKPIIGCEMYLAKKSRFEKNVESKGYAHLVLLAKDFKGYQNLCKLMTAAYMEGFYYKPRIDKELLHKHSEGIIALTACLAGEIPQALLQGYDKQAHELVDEYIQIFGKENLFVELMDHGIAEQKLVNSKLIPLARDFGLKLVATNDVHYLKKEHAEAHDLLLCIGTKSKVSDEKRMRFESKEFYLKSEAEMRAIFPDHPEAITNTRLVEEMCHLVIPTLSNTKGLSHYPIYDVSKSPYPTQRDYLRDICLDGVLDRYGFNPKTDEINDEKTYSLATRKEVMERLDFELSIIDKMGFNSYYLVVWDFLKFARDAKIPVGPGRGSGAGSIAAYVCHITDIEPLRYGLLFERFLNPERVSPPDFDIDFCERRRGEVIEYVRGKYGADSVAQIGTYGTLKPKAAIKDIARVLNYPPQVGDKITKTLVGSPDTLGEKTLKESPQFKVLLETDPETKLIVEKATPIFNLNRNMTIHAAGVIIGDQPLDNVVPLAKGANGEIVTQYPAGPCEYMGLLKMDFLGLRTLTICQDAVDLIKESKGIEINLSTLPVDNGAAYELIARGDTKGVFQLESGGMRNLCRQLSATKLEEIIALIALFRPGPMDFIPAYIAGQKDPRKIVYAHELLRPISEETYGILVYQEQVMQAARTVAGYSLGGADMLRRAMGKKKPEEMAKQREIFVEGAKTVNHIPAEKANEIFDILEKFAAYGFNKSHSAAYAVIAYRTAFLKANYPVEFMAACLTAELSNAEKMREFIAECQSMKIEVLGPDVNNSFTQFSVDGKNIRFGLAAIKGVGTTGTDAIIANRKEHGIFKSFEDFCNRCVELLSEASIESLIRAGGFDTMGAKRSQLLAVLPDVLKQAKQIAKDLVSGQDSFFDLLGDQENQNELMNSEFLYPDLEEMDESEMLKDEMRLVGFYLSGHPLSKYGIVLRDYMTHSLSELSREPEVDEEGNVSLESEEDLVESDTPVRVAGILKSVQNKMTKNDKPMSILVLEDLTGRIDCLAMGKTLSDSLQGADSVDLPENTMTSMYLKPDHFVMIEGVLSRKEGKSPSIFCDKIMPLQAVQEHFTNELHIHIFENQFASDHLMKLQDILTRYPGTTRLVLCLKTVDNYVVFLHTSEAFYVRCSSALIDEVTQLLGDQACRFKANITLRERRKRYVPRVIES